MTNEPSAARRTGGPVAGPRAISLDEAAEIATEVRADRGPRGALRVGAPPTAPPGGHGHHCRRPAAREPRHDVARHVAGDGGVDAAPDGPHRGRPGRHTPGRAGADPRARATPSAARSAGCRRAPRASLPRCSRADPRRRPRCSSTRRIRRARLWSVASRPWRSVVAIGGGAESARASLRARRGPSPVHPRVRRGRRPPRRPDRDGRPRTGRARYIGTGADHAGGRDGDRRRSRGWSCSRRSCPWSRDKEGSPARRR